MGVSPGPCGHSNMQTTPASTSFQKALLHKNRSVNFKPPFTLEVSLHQGAEASRGGRTWRRSSEFRAPGLHTLIPLPLECSGPALIR